MGHMHTQLYAVISWMEHEIYFQDDNVCVRGDYFRFGLVFIKKSN